MSAELDRRGPKAGEIAIVGGVCAAAVVLGLMLRWWPTATLTQIYAIVFVVVALVVVGYVWYVLTSVYVRFAGTFLATGGLASALSIYVRIGSADKSMLEWSAPGGEIVAAICVLAAFGCLFLEFWSKRPVAAVAPVAPASVAHSQATISNNQVGRDLINAPLSQTGQGPNVGPSATQYVGGQHTHYHAPAATTAAPASPLHQLPAPPGDFVGREVEIRDILARIESGGAVIAGMYGMGGIGKTALAYVLAHKLRDRCPDAQFYLDLKATADVAKGERPLTPADALAHVIRGFHPEAKLPEDEASLAALYRSVLDGKRVLLVMDNALDAAQVEPLVPPAGCQLLVTSRQHFTLPALYARDIDRLPRPKSLELLTEIAPRLAGAKEADEIAELCGDLPLALRAAAGALVERANLSPADLARRLRDEQKRLKHLGPVEGALAASGALLDADLRGRWYALAVFPRDFDALAAAAVWKIDTDAAQDALGELLRRSLIEFDPTAQRYRLHDLIRVYAASRLTADDERNARHRHAVHYCDVLAACDEKYLAGGAHILAGLSLFDLERPNIDTGFAWSRDYAADDKLGAELCNRYPGAGNYCLNLRQHPREWIAWLDAALTAARFLKDRRAESNHIGNLGHAYADLSDVRKAIEYYEQQLIIAREIGDRHGEGSALLGLGCANNWFGDAQRAISHLQHSLNISRELGDRRAEGDALCNLGNAYENFGDVRQAIDYYVQDLTIARETGDRRGEGQVLGNLGLAYTHLGDNHRAIQYFEQNLGIARQIGDQRSECATLTNLGLAYTHLTDRRRAIEHYEQSLAIARKIGGRQGESIALGGLGVVYADLGDFRRAIDCYDKQLSIAREIGDRQREGHALGELGLVYSQLADERQAIEYYEQSLTVAREIGDRRSEAYTSWNLGIVAANQGDIHRAVELMQVCVEFERQIGHTESENHAAQVDDLRARLAAQGPSD